MIRWILWKVGIYLVVAVVLILTAPLVVAVILAVPAILIGTYAYRRYLRWQFARSWGAAGKRNILVYSNSPHWKQYVEERWIPQLASSTVILNWSERRRWDPKSVEVRAWREWGGVREHNPSFIHMLGGGRVLIVRFWRAFRDFKHGKDRALRAAEREMWRLVERE